MGADHDAYFEEVEARFENAHDLDLGLEEEFQVLDRETLALTGAFEVLRDSAPARLRERIAGELLTLGDRGLHAAHAALRAGGEAAPAQPGGTVRARRRAGLRARLDGHPPVLGLEGPADHRHAALPAGRGPPQVRRLAQQHLGGARARRGPRLRQGGGGLRRAADVPAAPARAVRELTLHRGRLDAAALGAHADVRAHVPALRHPGRVRHVGGASRLLRGARRHQLHPGVHPDLVVGAAASPLRHRGGPHLRRADRGVAEPRDLVTDRRADRPPRSRLR